MKQPYRCPECQQVFSRRWNLRQHCRTKHGFDPSPSIPTRISTKATDNPSNRLENILTDRFLNESQFITDDWLAQKDKAGLKTFSLNI